MVAFGALIKTLSSKLMVTVRLNLFITNRHGYIICLNWTLFLAVCSRFFEWDFFLKSLNLANEGQVNIISANIYQSCQVVPGSAAYYNYQLENKWVGINLEMFKVEKTQNKLFFKVLYLKFFKCKRMQASSSAAIMACDSQLHCSAVCISFHGKQSVVKNCNDKDVLTL